MFLSLWQGMEIITQSHLPKKDKNITVIATTINTYISIPHPVSLCVWQGVGNINVIGATNKSKNFDRLVYFIWFLESNISILRFNSCPVPKFHFVVGGHRSREWMFDIKCVYLELCLCETGSYVCSLSSFESFVRCGNDWDLSQSVLNEHSLKFYLVKLLSFPLNVFLKRALS